MERIRLLGVFQKEKEALLHFHTYKKPIRIVQTATFLLTGALLASGAIATDWGTCIAPAIKYDKPSGFASNVSGYSQGVTTSHTPITDYIYSALKNQCKVFTDAYKICTSAASAAFKKSGNEAAMELIK
ncbi:hypothetical protein BGZ60DRAFT_436587 [Tricladium varicosporioides]|nr:hypothetical protein BGZ60DRAFT_436587 [Hymenoscyphus varicosporioides]